MSDAVAFPQPLGSDPEDVSWALSTGHSMWMKGDRAEGLKWLKRASDSAAEAGDDARALNLAHAAAELRSKVSEPAAPRPPMAPPPPPPEAFVGKAPRAASVPPPPPPEAFTQAPSRASVAPPPPPPEAFTQAPSRASIAPPPPPPEAFVVSPATARSSVPPPPPSEAFAVSPSPQRAAPAPPPPPPEAFNVKAPARPSSQSRQPIAPQAQSSASSSQAAFKPKSPVTQAPRAPSAPSSTSATSSPIPTIGAPSVRTPAPGAPASLRVPSPGASLVKTLGASPAVKAPSPLTTTHAATPSSKAATQRASISAPRAAEPQAEEPESPPARKTMPTPTQLYHDGLPAEAHRPAPGEIDEWPTNAFDSDDEALPPQAPAAPAPETEPQGSAASLFNETTKVAAPPAPATMGSIRVWIVASSTGVRLISADAYRPDGAIEAFVVSAQGAELERLISRAKG